MGERRQVQIVETVDIIHDIQNEATGGWRYNPDGKMRWLQRLAAKVLSRWGLPGFVIKETTTYGRFDPDQLFEMLDKTAHATILDFVNRGAWPKIYIGSEDFRDMMRLPDIRDYMNFSSRPDLHDRNGPVIFDMPVEVIPWMRGVLVVPA